MPKRVTIDPLIFTDDQQQEVHPVVLYEGKYHCRLSLKTGLIAEADRKLDWDRAEVTIIEI